jgi:hypothetical protein
MALGIITIFEHDFFKCPSKRILTRFEDYFKRISIRIFLRKQHISIKLNKGFRLVYELLRKKHLLCFDQGCPLLDK